MVLRLTGETRSHCQIEAATDLTNWLTLTILTNDFGTAQFTDTNATDLPVRLYRAVQLP